MITTQQPSTKVAADPTSTLAGQMLAAQLNLNIGAETCPAAEESVIAGQVMLTSTGYDGSAGVAESSPVADDGAMEMVIEYLEAYNSGLLCQ